MRIWCFLTIWSKMIYLSIWIEFRCEINIIDIPCYFTLKLQIPMMIGRMFKSYVKNTLSAWNCRFREVKIIFISLSKYSMYVLLYLAYTCQELCQYLVQRMQSITQLNYLNKAYEFIGAKYDDIAGTVVDHTKLISETMYQTLMIPYKDQHLVDVIMRS